MPLSRLRPAGKVAIESTKRRKREKDYQDYRLESGRDPYAEDLQSMIPVNAATETAKESGPLAGIASWAGGGPAKGAMSVVANPTHPMAQFLAKNWPKPYAALERRPQIFEFQDKVGPAGEGKIKFPTNSLRGEHLDEIDLSKLKTVDNPSGNQQPIGVEITNATQRLPDTDPEKHVTALHEVLHGLYGTNPNVASFSTPKNRAFTMLYGNTRPNLYMDAPMGNSKMRPSGARTRFSLGSATRAGLDSSDVDALVEVYRDKGADQHMNIETLARTVLKSGLKDIPDPGAQTRTRRTPFSFWGREGSGSDLSTYADKGLHKDVNDYARFVMGKQPGLERDVDPNILRQFEGGGQGGLSTASNRELQRSLDRSGWLNDVETPIGVPRVKTDTRHSLTSPMMSLKTDIFDPEAVARIARNQPELGLQPLSEEELLQQLREYNRLSGY